MHSKNSGIYIHIPYCRQKCDYCNFVSFCDFSSQEAYVERVMEEIKQRSNSSEIIDTIYIGGGTPSVLYRGGITKIRDSVYKNFRVASELEFTIEANPESCSDEFLRECVGSGINRLSLGLQSSDDSILREAGRRHSYEQFCDALSRARKIGIGNISADLIIGLKGESAESFKTSLKQLIELSLEHISIYSLKCEEGTRLYSSGFEPNEDLMSDLYELALGELGKSGYNRYEVSNFAKLGYESRHNLKYWTLCSYYGFGVSAHSYYQEDKNNVILKSESEIEKEVCGKRMIRRANTANLEKYLRGEFRDYEQDVTDDEREEFIMLGLRLKEGISLAEYEKRFKKSILETHKEEIENLIKSGHLIIEKENLKIPQRYSYLMNAIILPLI